MVLAITAFLGACSGIVAYFSGDLIFPIIAAAITLILSLVLVAKGVQKGLKIEIATAVIGLLVSFIFNLPKLATVALSLCIGQVVITLTGWIMLLISRAKQND